MSSMRLAKVTPARSTILIVAQPPNRNWYTIIDR